MPFLTRLNVIYDIRVLVRDDGSISLEAQGVVPEGYARQVALALRVIADGIDTTESDLPS